MMLLTAFEAQHVLAQATNASITGKVLDDTNLPLVGATIMVENGATGFKTYTITSEEGNFNFQQLPLGKPYSVTVSFIGYSTKVRNGYELNQGDRINLEFKLTSGETELDEVIISANNLDNEIDKLGGVTSISSTQIKNLPTEGRNFTSLTSLSPLQGGGSINLGGQRRTSTNITLDGVNARNQLTAGEIGRGPYTVSIEAIREFEVVTNSYDVTQGRQAGGALNAVTKAGTNELSGSAFVYHRNDKLASQFDIRGNDRTQDFYNYQWGFSLGGPIIKNKMHFFMAFDRQDAGDPVFITDINSPDDERRLGVKRDTLNKALDIVRRLYGVSDAQQVGQFSRKTVANTIFARIDWQLNNRNKLTIRNNFTDWTNPLSVNDNSNINLAEVYSDFTSRENSILASLRTAINPTTTNELKVQFQHAERAFLPNSQLPINNIPRGIVRITSPFPTESNPNATQTRTLQFGGQRFTPETNVENQLHLVNTTYLTKGKYQFTFGTDNMFTYLETLLSNEQNGRFFFDNLQDLENFKASRYAREVPLSGSPLVTQSVIDLAAFAQVEFELAKNLQAVFGVRYDVTAFTKAAAYNPILDQELGIRSDNLPSDWNNIQPRLQMTWNVKGKNTDILKFGAGLFSAQPHYYAQVNNIQNSGVMLAAIDVTGAFVPTPDFNSYRNDPSTVPGVPEGAKTISTINTVAADFQVPSTFKANINYNKYLNDRIRVGLNLVYSNSFNNYVYLERNLVDQPVFRLANEANRGVFVPASTISNRGLTNWLESRKSKDLGRVLELNSVADATQYAVIFDLGMRIGKDGYLNASYTYNQAKDNSSYNCCVANTSTFLPVVDDSRVLSRGYSDNQFKDKVVVNAASPTWKGFVFGASLVGIGGSRYSFLVTNGSLQGDFPLNNALAYVYDPNDPSTPENIREGINGILNDPNTTESAKKYLRESFGKVAERNGGENPFNATIDLRLIKNIKTIKGQALELSADVFNFANLLNKEYGVDNNLGRSRNLYSIQGFNQTAQTYNYRVESGVGVRPINGTPWRVQLGVRYAF
ncbi:MAG: hypothetical protein ACI9UV_001284 [Algoriphagus sp.]|jgi:hypothetical protein